MDKELYETISTEIKNTSDLLTGYIEENDQKFSLFQNTLTHILQRLQRLEHPRKATNADPIPTDPSETKKVDEI